MALGNMVNKVLVIFRGFDKMASYKGINLSSSFLTLACDKVKI